MSNLLEQWNEHVIKGNQLSRELEDFEGVMHVANIPESKVALSAGMAGTTYIDPVLSPETMAAIKSLVVLHLKNTREAKENELKKHMNSWKPATINPEFEAEVQDMELQSKSVPIEDTLPTIPDKQEQEIDVAPTYPEMTYEAVKHLYHDENITMKEIAEYFGVTKPVVNNFIYNNKLAKKKYKDDGFLDAKVEQRKKERP